MRLRRGAAARSADEVEVVRLVVRLLRVEALARRRLEDATDDDLLLLLESVRHPNQASRKGGKDWSLTPVALWTPRLPQLRQMFAELAPTERQCGLDDELRGWFAEERNAVGGRLLTTSYAPLLMQYARCGVPPGLRGRMWLGALRLGTVSERDYNYFATLQREIGRVTLATDDMVKKVDLCLPDVDASVLATTNTWLKNTLAEHTSDRLRRRLTWELG